MIQGIIEILTENAAVQQLVGLNVTSERYKVYPVRYPQEEGKASDVDKYITIYKTPGEPTQSKDESSTLDRNNFNVNCYASDYPGAYQMYEAVRSALDLRLVIETYIGFTYNGIWFLSDYDAFDDDSQKFIKVLSFSCHCKRT